MIPERDQAGLHLQLAAVFYSSSNVVYLLLSIICISLCLHQHNSIAISIVHRNLIMPQHES